MTRRPDADRSVGLVPVTPSLGRGRRDRRRRLFRRRMLLAGGMVAGAGLVVVVTLTVGLSALTSPQLLFLAHSASGILVLHAAAGGLVSLLPRLRSWVREWIRRASAIALAVGAWVAVLLGTWSGYPSYRAAPPPGSSATASPQAWLQAQPELAWWDTAMRWKVQIGWVSPLLLTAVAIAVLRYGPLVAADRPVRVLVGIALAIGVGAAAIASLIGVAVNVVAPNAYLRR